MADISKQLEEVDKQYPSPTERAHEIWSIISATPALIEKTDWDILCFCVEYVAMQSQNWRWLEDSAKELNRIVYTAHYLSSENHDDKLRNRRARGNIPIFDNSRSESERKSIIDSDGSDSPGSIFE